VKRIPIFSKAVAKLQLYQSLHTNTKHRSLNVTAHRPSITTKHEVQIAALQNRNQGS